MLTAILIDGPFFVKRIRQIFPQTVHYDGRNMADLVWRLSAAHLFERNQPKRHLFRIFFYDSPCVDQKVTLPMTRTVVDISKTREGQFKNAFHRQLQRKRKLALRLGEPLEVDPWRLREDAQNDLIAGRMSVDELQDDDFIPNGHPRGVELRIGVDLATLAYKRQVQQVVLIAGDGFFAPASELARHEGIDIVLDPMWQNIPEELFAYIDGLRSTCPPTERAVEFLHRIHNEHVEHEEEVAAVV
jgi:uncharacterized LabA/DUF88 family protein